MFAKIFKESDRVPACPSVSTEHQKEKWTHQPRGAVVTDMEDSDLDEEDSVMPTLIYL